MDEADSTAENIPAVSVSSNNKKSSVLTQKPPSNQSVPTGKIDQHPVSYDDFLLEQTPPPIEGDIVMDGEDILNVVVVNRIIPYTPQKDIVRDSSEDDDLSFWAPEEADSHSFLEQDDQPTLKETDEQHDSKSYDDQPTTKEEDDTMTEQISQDEQPAVNQDNKNIRLESSKNTSVMKQSLAQIEGDVTFPGGGTIFANIHGNVIAKGILNFCGTIDGNVEAEDIYLKGTINGTLKCRKLTMTPIDQTTMSRINGAISAESLFTEFS